MNSNNLSSPGNRRTSVEQPDDDIPAHLARIEHDGYTILEEVIDDDLRLRLLADLQRIEVEHGVEPAPNRFEGFATTRVYNLLAHGPLWQQVPLLSSTLAVVEGVLDRDCLISSISSIAIGPGETAQPVHADDQIQPIGRPHPATVCNSMWALTDFTEANGATRIVPGSHKLDHNPPYDEHQETIAAEMTAGSVMIWNGSMWHGGGANTTDSTRVGIAMNYCAGWIRQQENQQLGLPTDLVAQFTPRLRELCGFGVYHGLMGHINKQSPGELLFGDPPMESVWDTADRYLQR